MVNQYKILVDGKACHGGKFTYDLPKPTPVPGWIPGRWHVLEGGSPELCVRGFHTTSQPALWWKQDAVCYLTETEGVTGSEGDKQVCSRIRLLRPLTEKELNRLGVFTQEKHQVEGMKRVAVSGTADVIMGLWEPS